MTDIGSTGYMTDGEIMAWLEAKSSDQYAALNDQMGASNERSATIKDLSNLSTEVQAGQSVDDRYNAVQQFLTDHKDSPEAANYEDALLHLQIKMLAGVSNASEKADEISKAIDESPLTAEQKQGAHDYLNQAQAVLDGTADSDTTEKFQKAATAQGTFTTFGDTIKTVTSDLGNIDQLQMIKIQQLVSDARQTDQLASNILSSRDQTSNAIVGNIRG
jgi:hypothetical protein